MLSDVLDVVSLKSELLEFTKTAVSKFLLQHEGLTFYAFAFDCNAEYTEVNLSLNTEDAFKQTLRDYQTGEYAKYYQDEGGIRDLKYSVGDWKYLCFETIRLLSDDKFAKLYNECYGENIEKLNEDLMTVFTETLLDFTLTNEYKSIPKTEDFELLCLDHDEDIAVAEKRLSDLREARSTQ